MCKAGAGDEILVIARPLSKRYIFFVLVSQSHITPIVWRRPWPGRAPGRKTCRAAGTANCRACRP
ncbi:hypothetical protein CBM2597_A10188 [Cupriavidus taiwanensis]|uniref:Uncharacterized protein n=1 Tax=Cupriavidus taiwanensis TaxID=164546 RepID=A0A7Z7J7F9_9BURK|nr:hypothetical protein CBM2597_A10188 [Cupriavidus taiwanensis]SPC06228.1 hypothetical protein CBM2594_A10190 [Cupriavidus taiwanensis]